MSSECSSVLRHHFSSSFDVFLFLFDRSQELSPTSDTNLVKSLMNLMDCMMDEFHDEAKMKSMNENDICSWLEVCEHTHCF